MRKLLFTTVALIVMDVFTFAVNPTLSEKPAELFLKHSEECLKIIESEALQMGVKGVAVVAFIPGEVSDTWVSKMKVVGTMSNESANFLAVAYSKAAEMAETFKDSGGRDQDPKLGEFGWQGGVIRKVKGGYLLAAFSGATGEQDVQAAKKGLDWLIGYF